MKRTLLILCAAAASLTAKDRAWQTGQLLDKALNPYFRVAAVSNDSGPTSTATTFGSGDNGALAVKPHAADGEVSYDNYVIASPDTVYLVEFAHFKSFQSANVSLSKPVTFAVEKDKLWIMDLDRREFETKIVRQVDAHPGSLAVAGQTAAPAADQVKAEQLKAEQAKVAQLKAEQAKADQIKAEQLKAEQVKAEQARAAQARADQIKAEQLKAEQVKAEQAKAAQARADQIKAEQLRAEQAKAAQARADQIKAEQLRAEQAKAEKPKPSKPDNVFATAALTNDDLNPPKPAPSAKATPAPAKPEPTLEASVTKPVQRPDPQRQPEPKVVAAVAKPPQRPEGPVVRAATKDRAWQSGQLLSVANNTYFFNVTYTSDTEGSSWPFSQGSDGRLTVTGQIADATNSSYTYDNYVIESQFVAYLVQRMRPKTSPPVRLPGTQPLKFAVDKGKMWVLDEQGIEYETKVVKLIQKDAIVDPLTRAAAR
jgi:hypothetical protein